MADFRGGRGKRVSYETQMYRIPTPLRPTIEALGLQFRLLWDGLSDPRGEKLISRIEAAIPDPDQLESGSLINLISDKRDGDIPDIKNELAELRSRLAEAKEENTRLDQELNEVHTKNGELNLAIMNLQDQLQDQAQKAGEWYEKAKALQEHSQSQPVKPEVLALLQKAITPEKEGGLFKSNRATPLKEAIEKALKLLGGN